MGVLKAVSYVPKYPKSVIQLVSDPNSHAGQNCQHHCSRQMLHTVMQDLVELRKLLVYLL
jgi:hypothetical protein